MRSAKRLLLSSFRPVSLKEVLPQSTLAPVLKYRIPRLLSPIPFLSRPVFTHASPSIRGSSSEYRPYFSSSSRIATTLLTGGISRGFNSKPPSKEGSAKTLDPATLIENMFRFLKAYPSVYRQEDGPDDKPSFITKDGGYRSIRCSIRTSLEEMKEIERANTYSEEEFAEIRSYVKDFSIEDIQNFFRLDLDGYCKKYALFQDWCVEPKKNLQRIKTLKSLGLYNRENVSALLVIHPFYQNQLMILLELYCRHNTNLKNRQTFFTQMAANTETYSIIFRLFKDLSFEHRWAVKINNLLIQEKDFPLKLNSLHTILKVSLKYHVPVEGICLAHLAKNQENFDLKAKILTALDEMLEKTFPSSSRWEYIPDIPKHQSIIVNKIISAILKDDSFMTKFYCSLNTINKYALYNQNPLIILQSFPEVDDLLRGGILSCSDHTVKVKATASTHVNESKSEVPTRFRY